MERDVVIFVICVINICGPLYMVVLVLLITYIYILNTSRVIQRCPDPPCHPPTPVICTTKAIVRSINILAII